MHWVLYILGYLSSPSNKQINLNFSTVKYRFDIGANVRAQSPAPHGNAVGKITTRAFNSLGRLERESLLKPLTTGSAPAEYAYTRYVYPQSQVKTEVYSTVTDSDNNGYGNQADEVLAESWTDGAGRVLRSRTPMSWNTSGDTLTWSGSKVEYDIRGQVKRSTVPTEVDGNWARVGEDALRPDWLWTTPEYDWKGRTTRTVNTDGTDTLINYEGCGCAGGEVVTEKSELIAEAYYESGQGWLPGRQGTRTYRDILGRTYKSDVLWWNGAVKSSVVNKLNGRDQIEWIKEYAGPAPSNALDDESCPSATCRLTKFTYDGHGRKLTEKLPEFDANKQTSWEYNLDDTVQRITDPRGATTNFSYNARRLVSELSYTVPSGSSIPVTPSVTFLYDAVGNRTQMNDQYGSVSYAFDSLSRISSETRVFTALNATHSIGYDYTLSNGLRELSDPADITRKVTYSHNKGGVLTGINGNGYGNVTNYLQNRQVRANGAVKSQQHGNGVQLNMQYDARQRLSLYEAIHAGQSVAKYSYTYTETGKLKESQNLPAAGSAPNKFSYDYRGLLTEVGVDALPEIGKPFNYVMQYNDWGDMTARLSSNWAGSEAGYFSNLYNTYSNNRNTRSIASDRRGIISDEVWQYDAAGNALQTGMQTHLYDAAGDKTRSVEQPTPSQTGNNGRVELAINQSYDALGEVVKRDERETYNVAPLREKTTYFLRSTVLGNAVLAELNLQGQKQKEFVYDSYGEPLASRENNNVYWKYFIPQTADRFDVNTTGAVSGQVTLDPLGNELMPAPPATGSPDWLPTNSDYHGSGNIFGGLGGGGGCLLDGQPLDCSFVAKVVAIGNPLAMGYGASLYMMNLTVMRSYTKVGTRESGYRWGRRIVIDRDNSGKPTRINEGGYSSDRTLHYLKTSGIYSSNISFGLKVSRPRTDFNYGDNGVGFSDIEKTKLKEAFAIINSDKCKNWINKTLKRMQEMADKLIPGFKLKYDNVNDLLANVELNRYGSSLTAEKMGITNKEWQDIRNQDGYRTQFRATVVGNKVWIHNVAFNRANATYYTPFSGPMSNLPGIIVHEMFHMAGLTGAGAEGMIDNKGIRENCGGNLLGTIGTEQHH